MNAVKRLRLTGARIVAKQNDGCYLVIEIGPPSMDKDGGIGGNIVRANLTKQEAESLRFHPDLTRFRQ